MNKFTFIPSWAVLFCFMCNVLISTAMAREPVGKAGEPGKRPAPAKEELSAAPAKVDVKPVARDEEIHNRLQTVLDAIGWFSGTSLGGVAGQGQMGNVGQCVLDVLKRRDVLAVPTKGMRFNDSGCRVAC